MISIKAIVVYVSCIICSTCNNIGRCCTVVINNIVIEIIGSRASTIISFRNYYWRLFSRNKYRVIIDAYFRARSIPSDVKILPAAVVDRSENWDYKSFYETTATNAGQSMKWFTDIESARAWLKSRL